eukprot:Pgem_evm1s16723
MNSVCTNPYDVIVSIKSQFVNLKGDRNWEYTCGPLVDNLNVRAWKVYEKQPRSCTLYIAKQYNLCLCDSGNYHKP